MVDWPVLTALVIFLITYVFIGIRQVPRVHIDRPAGALVGAVLMVVAGVLTLDEAFAAIDLHTILLLLGMMIITVYLRAAGFFELMADRIISLSRTPLQLLTLIAVSSGVLSALFVNDTICLLYTPIVLGVTVQLGVRPMPYLLALAMSSNIGSVMTVTGNPQNMLIGIASGIPYLSFCASLLPAAAAGLAICIAVLRILYAKDLGRVRFDHRPALPAYAVDRKLLTRSLVVCGGVLAAFSLGAPYALSAAAGAVVLMLIGGIRTERVLEGVDWTLLLFFAGLFVVMHGVEASGLAAELIGRTGGLSSSSSAGGIAGLSLVSAVLSNVVSNVPAVMLLRPYVEALGGDRIAWLVLAMSSTLAGNFTLIGSVANLIVVQQARRQAEIGFWEYFRAGAVVTVLTLAAGILVLALQAGAAHGAEAGPQPSLITVRPADPSGPERMLRIVLLCDSEGSRVRGLQGFRQLRRDEAALFLFDPPQRAEFWMASVAYPIDIIYVEPSGRVAAVFARCRPGSRDTYPSPVPVRWVIETAAGSGVKAGDRMLLQ